MTGLILKDLFMLKKSAKTVLFVLVIYVVWGYAMNNSAFASGFTLFFFSMMIQTTFSYDDLAKWNSYAITMPVSRKDLVSSKYILSILLTGVGTVVALLLGLFLTLIKVNALEDGLFIAIGVMMGVSLIFHSIIIPLTIKLGTEKSRFALFGIFLIPTLLIIGISKLSIPKPSDAFLHTLEQILPFALGCITILIFIASYFISVRIMEYKDF